MTNGGLADVTIPLCVGLFVSVVFFVVLWRRGHGGIPWFEIGSAYMAVVTLYLAFPLLGYIVLGGKYTPLNDNRLFDLSPDAREVARVAWLYVCHLVGFASAYLAIRGRLPKVTPRPQSPSVAIVVGLIVVYLMIVVFEITLGFFYNTTANNYLESYLVAQRLPLVIAQLSNHLSGMKYPLSLALLTVLFIHYRRLWPLIAIWLAIATSLGLARLGSRTEVLLLFVSATAMYHSLVKPLPARLIAGAAGVGLIGFLAFGMLRAGNVVANPFSAATEFEILFGNAIHLSRIGPTIERIPTALYFADLASLVPQQFVPFTKIDPAAWYVTQFFPFYASQGGGLAFGTIAEAVLTGGALSALARGAALGVCFATVHRAYLSRSRSFWVFVFYVWIITLCYQSFRNTTFALAVLIGYRFVPAVVSVTIVAAVLTAAVRWSSFRPGPITEAVS